MLQVFISSIQDGYRDVREAARRAVESLEARRGRHAQDSFFGISLSFSRAAYSVPSGFSKSHSPSKTPFVDRDAKLLRRRVDVPDVQMNERVGPGIALVF